LTAVAEQPGPPWAAALRTRWRAVRRPVRQGRAAGRVASPPDACATCGAQYRDLRAAGDAANPPPARPPDGPRRGRRKQRTARNPLDRLSAHEDAVWACRPAWTVPFDKNQAARDVRMLTVPQQVSGPFREVAGAAARCRIRSYVATRRKQARPLRTARELTCLGQPPLPCLVPV
jgi:hypothetical protein